MPLTESYMRIIEKHRMVTGHYIDKKPCYYKYFEGVEEDDINRLVKMGILEESLRYPSSVAPLGTVERERFFSTSYNWRKIENFDLEEQAVEVLLLNMLAQSRYKRHLRYNQFNSPEGAVDYFLGKHFMFGPALNPSVDEKERMVKKMRKVIEALLEKKLIHMDSGYMESHHACYSDIINPCFEISFKCGFPGQSF